MDIKSFLDENGFQGQINGFNDKGLTPIMLALFFGEKKIISELLTAGAQLDITTKTRKEAIEVWEAVCEVDGVAIALLAAYSYQRHQGQSNQGLTPLDCARLTLLIKESSSQMKQKSETYTIENINDINIADKIANYLDCYELINEQVYQQISKAFKEIYDHLNQKAQESLETWVENQFLDNQPTNYTENKFLEKISKAAQIKKTESELKLKEALTNLLRKYTSDLDKLTQDTFKRLYDRIFLPLKCPRLTLKYEKNNQNNSLYLWRLYRPNKTIFKELNDSDIVVPRNKCCIIL